MRIFFHQDGQIWRLGSTDGHQATGCCTRCITVGNTGPQIQTGTQITINVDIDVRTEVVTGELGLRVIFTGIRIFVVTALWKVIGQYIITYLVRTSTDGEADIFLQTGFEGKIIIIPVISQTIGVVSFRTAEIVNRLLREKVQTADVCARHLGIVQSGFII